MCEEVDGGDVCVEGAGVGFPDCAQIGGKARWGTEGDAGVDY